MQKLKFVNSLWCHLLQCLFITKTVVTLTSIHDTDGVLLFK